MGEQEGRGRGGAGQWKEKRGEGGEGGGRQGEERKGETGRGKEARKSEGGQGKARHGKATQGEHIPKSTEVVLARDTGRKIQSILETDDDHLTQ